MGLGREGSSLRPGSRILAGLDLWTEGEMETHVKVLGVLHIALGSLGVLAALTIFAVFGGLAGVIGATAEARDAAIAVPIVGLVGTIVIMFILVLSVPGIIVGAGLLKFQSWSRVFGIILSTISLLNFPFGTVIGAYGLWVLLTPETQPLFARPEPPKA